MRAREAKDFLVQQTAEQAQLDAVPLSDLEKRMMYFTETGEMPEDPIQLNDEFEAQYDTDEYEKKISRLMHSAYTRIKKENPESTRRWNDALKELRKGDHYLLVLWGADPDPAANRPPYDSLKLLGASFLIAVLLIVAMFVADHFGIHWGGRRWVPGTQSSMPVWLQRLLLGLFVGTYLYSLIAPWIAKRHPHGIARVLAKLLRVRNRENLPQ
jgi:hypothetical protein